MGLELRGGGKKKKKKEEEMESIGHRPLWGRCPTKTECNYVNNKLCAKYGASELFGSVNFTDCIKLAR